MKVQAQQEADSISTHLREGSGESSDSIKFKCTYTHRKNCFVFSANANGTCYPSCSAERGFIILPLLRVLPLHQQYHKLDSPEPKPVQATNMAKNQFHNPSTQPASPKTHYFFLLLSAICENAQENNNWEYGRGEKQIGGLFLLTAA